MSPYKYKPPKPVTQKNPLLNRPSKYKPAGGLHLENCPQIQRKQSKNSTFTSNYKANWIDFQTKFPSIDKPLKKSFWKI